MRTKFLFMLAVILAAGGAPAQTGNGVPGVTDYAAFAGFVAARNIFDPNRQPHERGSAPKIHPPVHSASAPAFTLVGTMSYDKGRFAFFNGNSSELKQVLPVTGGIAGYTITEISQRWVALESTNQADTNQTGKIELKIGDVMRQENNRWVNSGAGEIAGLSSPATNPATVPDSPSATDASTAAGNASASSQSDILKRLMERRQKENQ